MLITIKGHDVCASRTLPRVIPGHFLFKGKTMNDKKIIIDHYHPLYRRKWEFAGKNKYNGAYYYSKEIRKHFIPNIETTRNWVTINVPNYGADHAVVFIHNNLHPENYEWLKRHKDLVLVCGVPDTVDKVKHLGKAIYLPLSIDTEYVSKFKKRNKKKEVAFVGRPSKRWGMEFPEGTDFIEGMPREKLLAKLAEYKKAYCIGRTALEALCLGVEPLYYDPRFPNVDLWKLLDSKDAAKILQRELDIIDG